MADNVSMYQGFVLWVIATVIVVIFVYLAPTVIVPLIKTELSVVPANPALDPGMNGYIPNIQNFINGLAIIIEVCSSYICFKIATRQVTYNPGY